MKITRYNIAGHSKIAIESNGNIFDYHAILRSRNLVTALYDLDPEQAITYLLNLGLLDQDFIQRQLAWALHSDRSFELKTENLTPLLPLRPGKIVCVARNWREHAREGGHEMPDRPVIFCKTDNCALGHLQPIPIPTDLGQVDHEGELGVVISRLASQVTALEAPKYIHSYTIINDVTARTFQKDLASKKWPWYVAKSMDGFAPLGPHLMTPDEIDQLYTKRIKVSVNDEVRQDGSLADMHWKIPQLIEAITKHITLRPGDVIATGTPSGVGPINPGDQVTVEIQGLGILSNPVVKRPA